jgi:hypothetical protein
MNEPLRTLCALCEFCNSLRSQNDERTPAGGLDKIKTRYLPFSLIPSIIFLSSGCRSPIICIITGIERCITSGIF